MAEPARWGWRRSALDLLDRVGLARPAVRTYETALAARGAARRRTTSDTPAALPLPPARLRAQVGPLHADADFFLRSGEYDARLIRELVADAGSPVAELEALLDWGCGCGRVLRHWRDLPRTRVHGCDVDARMVRWCEENLPFVAAAVTKMSPPLPYDDSAFDLVYAFSVFTHLSEKLQHAWIAECRRVLRPGGFLLVSTLGEHYASLDRLTDDERRAFAAGGLVVLYDRAAGTSLCSAYHPASYVHETLARGFDIVAFRPAGDDGKHDIHLLRKRAA